MGIAKRIRLATPLLLIIGLAYAGSRTTREDKFRQLEELLPTPNSYRTASGAPGHEYWQQEANYMIDVELDDDNQRIHGSEQITYVNHSPDTLTYLWVQLDPNLFAPDSHAVLTALSPVEAGNETSYRSMKRALNRADFDGSLKISAVVDGQGQPLPHKIVETMMRLDLPKPLASGQQTTFGIDWSYTVNDAENVRGRTGCEYFEEDGNYIYEIAQWFPRMAAYTDSDGWQNKQYLGRGEFTLEFGDYLVRITVPDDHIVAATGTLQNPEAVLTLEQRARLDAAVSADKPVFVVTPEEAKAKESTSPTGKHTWVYFAENVRDFAFASSRKFIWDAMGYDVGAGPGMAMSYYPNAGEPLWSKYSTHAILHTLEVYSRYTLPYPYPVAISVNGPVGGMEYPMICFNGPRPEEDGTYSKRTKYGLISVIIHEVGHNFFPMIINSDERQWTWMDEGLNTFVQYLAEQEWEPDYPSRRGEPQNIVKFMKSDAQVPIMTNSESLLQFGSNAYAKPATALNVLRETVMGRELFDFAFQQYARRWMFKRPEPADLFRTLEDASAVDLDWFWRGWFYSTDHCDLALSDLRHFTIDTRDPEIEKARQKQEREQEPVTLSQQRNESLPKRTDKYPELLDFYNEFEELDVTVHDREQFAKLLEQLEDDEKELLASKFNFYVLEIANRGGLVSPVVVAVEYEDETNEELRLPAEIWRRNSALVHKLLVTEKRIRQLILDPHLETPDVDLDNNYYPRRTIEERLRLDKRPDTKNPMQKARDAEKRADEDTDPATAGG